MPDAPAPSQATSRPNLARIHRRDLVELVKRGMSDEWKGRQGFIPTDWAGAECVSDAKGILTDRGAGDGRDQRADGSRRHAGTGLAQICEAVRQSSGRGRRRWAIRRVEAGLSVSPGRS